MHDPGLDKENAFASLLPRRGHAHKVGQQTPQRETFTFRLDD